MALRGNSQWESCISGLRAKALLCPSRAGAAKRGWHQSQALKQSRGSVSHQGEGGVSRGCYGVQRDGAQPLRGAEELGFPVLAAQPLPRGSRVAER